MDVGFANVRSPVVLDIKLPEIFGATILGYQMLIELVRDAELMKDLLAFETMLGIVK